MRLPRRRFAGLVLAALVTGCASPSPILYTLAAVPGTPESGGPPTVTLHAASLTRTLERPEIVRSSENYRVAVFDNDWWGEPIGPMIGRVMAADLAQRLPGTTVLGDRGAITAEHAAAVELNISRLDADLSGAVVLDAQAAVRFGGAANSQSIRTVRFTVAQPSPDAGGQVAAMSVALGRLADVIAALLRAQP